MLSSKNSLHHHYPCPHHTFCAHTLLSPSLQTIPQHASHLHTPLPKNTKPTHCVQEDILPCSCPQEEQTILPNHIHPVGSSLHILCYEGAGKVVIELVEDAD